MEDQLETLDAAVGSGESPDGKTGNKLVDFLYPAPAPRNSLGIVKWWEARRLKFNAIVGGTGLVSGRHQLDLEAVGPSLPTLGPQNAFK